MSKTPINYAKALIIEFEGFKNKTYKCPAGVDTIGYGFTAAYPQVKPYLEKGVITKKEAEELLEHICRIIACDVVDYDAHNGATYNFKANELGALISFVFNLGITSYNKSTLKKLVTEKEKNYTNIYLEFLQWNKSGGKELKGLTKRREAEAKVFCQDEIDFE